MSAAQRVDRSPVSHDASAPALSVVHIQRLPVTANFSIERVFGAVRAALSPREFRVSTWIAPRASTGVTNRLQNILRARALRADVLHITGDIGYVSLAMSGVVLLTVHDLVLLRRFSGWRRWVARALWYDLPCLRADRVTTVSEFTRRELIAETSCAPDKIIVIPNPLLASAPRKTRQRREVPHILMVGTAWNKNFVRQTEALAGIPCTVELVGVLSEAHRLAFERAGVSYSTTYDVSDDAMMERYAEADLLMFASTYEGFGMPIIEAQSVGTPVLTSVTTSMPEVAGDGACLVDPESVSAIRAGVLRILNEEEYRNALVLAGYENVRKFTPDAVAGQYAALYRDAHASRRERSMAGTATGDYTPREITNHPPRIHGSSMRDAFLHTFAQRLRDLARSLTPAKIVEWKHRRIRERTHERFRDLSNREVFSQIYEQQLWGGKAGEFYSGHGSDDAYGMVYVDAIRGFIDTHGIRSVVDVGCGDFRIGARIREGIDYTGVDVVPSLIAAHERNHGNANTRFLVRDATTEPLPAADLCLVRQVLQHLSNDEIARVLAACAHFPNLIVTEHFPAPAAMRAPNLDKPHGPEIRAGLGSAVCLDQPPFSWVIAETLCEVTVESDGSVIRTMRIERPIA